MESHERWRRWTWAVVVIAAFFLKWAFWDGILIAEASENTKKSSELRKERASAMEEDILNVARSSSSKTFSQSELARRDELLHLKKELLQFPKKKRLRFGGDFDMTYDTNANRLPVHHEEGDTFFNMNPFIQLELGGAKTKLGVEYRTPFLYNVKRSVNPGTDSRTQELTVRSSRKILPRTLFSLNERLSRLSISQQSKDNRKVRWDQSHRASLNYELSKKFSISVDGSHARTDFPNEDYDQDYTRTFTLNPSIFFQITPKTKLSGNYGYTYSRSQAKSSDSRTHEFRLGYTGKITGKSSLSTDVALSHQSPDSAAAATTNSIVYSLGYIWQATHKTSLRLLYSSSYTFSMTDAIATSGHFEFTKTRTYSVSDSLSLSTRLRVNPKLSTELSCDLSHSRSKSYVSEGEPDVTKSRTWTFPFQVALDYQLMRWCRLRFAYTFRHRLGDERKTDENRAHTWFLASNLSF